MRDEHGWRVPIPCADLRAMVPRPCPRYLACNCPDADDGHCCICAHGKGEHREEVGRGD